MAQRKDPASTKPSFLFFHANMLSNMTRILPLLGLLAILPPSGLLAAGPTVRPLQNTDFPVVRVNSTNQTYDFFRPWSKKNPSVRHGLGTVLAGNKVIVTAEMVSNHTYVELERAESGAKISANVVCVDYESNIALLEPTSEKFLDGLKPVDLVQDAVVGDRVNVVQLESNDALVTTPGPITTIEVGRYQLENNSYLLYRLSLPLQYREGSFTAPVIKDGKLAGILMRYDPRAQSVDVLPAPVIAHFLKDFADGRYQGFPRAGFEFAPTRDPQLRHYAKLPPSGGGVYVTNVVKDTPAAAGGLLPGDVVTELAGQTIDQDGNYDEPIYGKISMNHLITTKAFVGDKVPVKVSRGGEAKDLEITLAHRAPQDYVSQPYVIDEPPRYYVVGGLIFQELSRQYLKEWGGDWQKQAPQRLVYLDRFQSTLVTDSRKRIVVLSQVLPMASTIGYEEINYQVVKAVNGQPLSSLADLPKALEKPLDGFDKIELEEFPRMLFLDAAKLADDNKAVQESYGLPALQRID